MKEFRCPVLKELTDQQVRFTPPPRRREQLVRAQQLLAEIDPNRRYPYQFVCFRITEYRSDAYPDLVISGEELKPDLVLFIQQVERSIPPLPIEQELEPIFTLDEISKQFNVSTKTITRWRGRGLVGRWVLINGRRQLGYPQSVVEQFLNENQDRVERSSRFSHLTLEEKEAILRRARRLARAGGGLTEVSKRIARRLQRSVEAVRYTIKNFDREHPDRAIFPDVTGPLEGETKAMIANAYEQGTPVTTITKQYRKQKTTVYRAINEQKAVKLIAPPLDYIPNETFLDSANAEAYLAPMPGEEEFQAAHTAMKPPRDVPPELTSLYEWPLLSKDQEQHLFRQMNYLKYLLSEKKKALEPATVLVGQMKEIEELQAKIRFVKDRLINCNMRLVASIAKKHAGQTESLFELISDGNMSLMRAVEKFDYARGNKFSTYASWAIMKNFARSLPEEKHYRERYVTGHDDLFEARVDVRTDEQECMAKVETARARISQLLDGLDPRTRDVIRMRNGLDGSEEMTLEQIGKHFGITKERVRQINVRGMKILRERAQAAKVELP